MGLHSMRVRINEMTAPSKRASRRDEALAAQLRERQRHLQGYTPRAQARGAVAIAFVMGIVSTIGTVVLAAAVSETGTANRIGCMMTRWTGSAINHPVGSSECPLDLVRSPGKARVLESLESQVISATIAETPG